MTEGLANIIVVAIGAYVVLGLLVGLVYMFGAAGRIDPAAKGMPIRARVLIFPGIVGLWPLMLAKLFSQTEPPVS